MTLDSRRRIALFLYTFHFKSHCKIHRTGDCEEKSGGVSFRCGFYVIAGKSNLVSFLLSCFNQFATMVGKRLEEKKCFDL